VLKTIQNQNVGSYIKSFGVATRPQIETWTKSFKIYIQCNHWVNAQNNENNKHIRAKQNK